MSICEKCWADAGMDMTGDQPLRYLELVKDRDKTGHACTPEQQAGPEAGFCPSCKRWTLHQWTERCMVDGCAERGSSGKTDQVST